MLSLISIYGVGILASMVLAAALALLGCHIAARDRSMQTLCVGQGALLGVLFSLGIAAGMPVISEFTMIPMLLAFLFACLTHGLGEALVKRKKASKNTVFVAFFSALLASCHLLTALFPALENHMAQKYFGDLATMTQWDSQLTLFVGTALLAIMIFRRHSLARASFDHAILGLSSVGSRESFFFSALAMLVIGFCVQYVGYLFTIACLFIPTSILSLWGRAGLTRYLSWSALIASLSTVVGFLASLEFSHLPTVPTIILTMVGTGILLATMAAVRYRFSA